MRTRSVIVALCAVVMVLVAAWATAQAVIVRPVPPTIVSGADVGFRIEGYRGGTPVGTIVVKQDGQWVAAEVGAARPTRQISER